MAPVTVKTSASGTVYQSYGDPAAHTVILIHGLGLTRATWDGHLEALVPHFHVFTYDLYGHGQSAAPSHDPDLTLFSQQIRDLMDELAISSAALVGFSLGGMINRRFAIDHPSRVSALGILNSPHERGEAAQRLVEERARDTTAGGPGATIEATLKRWFTPDFLVQNQQVAEDIKSWVMANDHEVYAKCRYVLANGVVELIRPEPAIKTPTLVITCENDTGSTPAMSVEIAAEIADAELLIIPQLQHMGLVEQPDLFTVPLVDFLTKRLS